MHKKMLVESNPHQTRIAILESDRLTETFIERRERHGVVGNIYKGRVNRVLPGMQAAFVDIGLERDAFLYVDDVGQIEENGELASDGDAFGDEEQGSRSIDELVAAGQEVLVQVTKDPLPGKGARATMNVTLPSRYLVLLPTVRHLGVSRRIEAEEERERLRAILEELASDGCGLIVRTAGEGRTRCELQPDVAYLSRLWKSIREASTRVTAPVLVHRDLDLSLRVVRDWFAEDYAVLWVDDEETYERIVSFLDEVQPSLVDRVRLDRRDEPLFERFGVEQELEAALASKVWLRSGGHLVINQTEALVAVDVNTGRFVGRESLEETAFRTNLEAVGETVRQIRLRDLSGILILDLIDMSEQEHRDQVFATLETELAKDRAKSKVLNISEFGLVELTRKRSHANLERLLTRPCPYCRGTGRVKTLSTICLDIRRKVLQTAPLQPHRQLMVRLHPEVAEALQTQERKILEELEQHLGARVLLQSDGELHHERYDVLEV